MNSFKAPDPNGIQAHFFKHGWDIVKPSLLEFVNHVLQNPESLSDVHLSLIPNKILLRVLVTLGLLVYAILFIKSCPNLLSTALNLFLISALALVNRVLCTAERLWIISY